MHQGIQAGLRPRLDERPRDREQLFRQLVAFMAEPAAILNGRRAEAARNDGVILDAAREVFLADPASQES